MVHAVARMCATVAAHPFCDNDEPLLQAIIVTHYYAAAMCKTRDHQS